MCCVLAAVRIEMDEMLILFVLALGVMAMSQEGFHDSSSSLRSLKSKYNSLTRALVLVLTHICCRNEHEPGRISGDGSKMSEQTGVDGHLDHNKRRTGQLGCTGPYSAVMHALPMEKDLAG
jgi:hypothetical protein